MTASIEISHITVHYNMIFRLGFCGDLCWWFGGGFFDLCVVQTDRLLCIALHVHKYILHSHMVVLLAQLAATGFVRFVYRC